MVEWEQSLQEIVETCIGLAKQFHVTAYLACCSVQNCMKLMGVNCADIHTNIHTQRHTHTSTLKHTHTHYGILYIKKVLLHICRFHFVIELYMRKHFPASMFKDCLRVQFWTFFYASVIFEEWPDISHVDACLHTQTFLTSFDA